MEKIKLNGDNFAALKMGFAEVLLSQAFANPKLNYKVENSDLVFHYTTLEKFVSIIESQSFYFTNLNYLNDSKEYYHGVDLIIKIIKNYSTTEHKRAILDAVVENITHIYKSPKYIACFSKNGDLLGQWRAYANNGKGIAVGFRTENIPDFHALNISPMNIEYNESVQTNVITEIITIALNYFEEIKEVFDWTGYSYEYLISTQIIETLEVFISTFKHPTFSEEKEFRLEYCVDGNMNKKEDHQLMFRATENLIIPFLKIPYSDPEYDNEYKSLDEQPSLKKKLPIEKIIIGPSLNFDLNYESIQNLLLTYGYEKIEIVQSEIPYRL
jgi:Protein of unknown function (DUF2971)